MYKMDTFLLLVDHWNWPNNWQESNTSSQYGDHFCQIVVKSNFKKNKLWAGLVFAARYCDLDLQGSDPNVAWDMACQYGDHFCEIPMLWARHDFAARSCCDLDLKGSDPNVMHATLSQYGDHFCKIVLKSDFKLLSYVPDTILIQGHAVTLTFKVATQMLRVHIVHIATYSCTKYHAPSFNSF